MNSDYRLLLRYLLLSLQTVIPLLELRLLCSLGGLGVFWYLYLFGLRESEYAAWTLVNGYALNHVTISTHQLKSALREINNLNEFIEENGFKLNSEGATLKGYSFLVERVNAIDF